MINVTKVYLPNIEKYQKYVASIFKSEKITNNGPLVLELEQRLESYLGVDNIVLVSNGTLAIQLALLSLDIKKEVITTPYSFVATTSSIVFNNIKPVFSDIDPLTLNINPKEIENKITKNTEAILPVHVYGNPCDCEQILDIANRNNLKIIYDASHAFAVNSYNKSLLSHGDISTLSFHATKVFHTVEGGALIVNNPDLLDRVKRARNFGIEKDYVIREIGINAKMNELQAAMGLCILDDIEHIIDLNEEHHNVYKKELIDYVEFPVQDKFSNSNYSYFPIFLEDEQQCLKVIDSLHKEDIYPRRYFYPSLDLLDYVDVSNKAKFSNAQSKKVICLPMGYDLSKKDQIKICNIIKGSL